jgi:hypothetical protein
MSASPTLSLHRGFAVALSYPFSVSKDGVLLMRILAIAISAAFLAWPAVAHALACKAAGQYFAKATTADYSAAKKKKTKKPKEKVEYMRAAPMK